MVAGGSEGNNFVVGAYKAKIVIKDEAKLRVICFAV
jgi:hypothetical protein